MQSFIIEIVDAALKSPFGLAFVRLKKSNSLSSKALQNQRTKCRRRRSFRFVLINFTHQCISD